MIYDIITTTAGVKANADVGDRLMNLEIGTALDWDLRKQQVASNPLI